MLTDKHTLLFYFENAPNISLTFLKFEKAKCKYFDFVRLLFHHLFSLAHIIPEDYILGYTVEPEPAVT